MLGLEPVPSALEPCLPTVPLEPLEFLTKFSEIIEIHSKTEIRTA